MHLSAEKHGSRRVIHTTHLLTPTPICSRQPHIKHHFQFTANCVAHSCRYVEQYGLHHWWLDCDEPCGGTNDGTYATDWLYNKGKWPSARRLCSSVPHVYAPRTGSTTKASGPVHAGSVPLVLMSIRHHLRTPPHKYGVGFFFFFSFL